MNIPFIVLYAPGVPPILVLDFDGTVCVGDAPVRRYAEEVLRHAEPAVRGELTEALQRYFAGDPGVPEYADGYVAVAEITGSHLAPGVLNAGYEASRRALAARELDIATPPGLAEFLAGLAGRARRVLVTNAPPTGIAESLELLGLTALIDEVRTGAGKPGGFATLLPELLRGAPARTLMSVGDMWVNDIEPAVAAGCATALVARAPRPAHLWAPKLPELYDAIDAWVDDPASLPHPPELEIP